MSPALATDILQFTFESDKPAYKATLAAVAQARHVRPVFLERQPREARHAAMLVDFLNALEIKNEEGVVEDLPAMVEDAKLKAAVELLAGKYPHEVVAVYLNAFNDMNTAGWANLKAILESDARLQLGNH